MGAPSRKTNTSLLPNGHLNIMGNAYIGSNKKNLCWRDVQLVVTACFAQASSHWSRSPLSINVRALIWQIANQFYKKSVNDKGRGSFLMNFQMLCCNMEPAKHGFLIEKVRCQISSVSSHFVTISCSVRCLGVNTSRLLLGSIINIVALLINARHDA